MDLLKQPEILLREILRKCVSFKIIIAYKQTILLVTLVTKYKGV